MNIKCYEEAIPEIIKYIDYIDGTDEEKIAFFNRYVITCVGDGLA